MQLTHWPSAAAAALFNRDDGETTKTRLRWRQKQRCLPLPSSASSTSSALKAISWLRFNLVVRTQCFRRRRRFCYCFSFTALLFASLLAGWLAGCCCFGCSLGRANTQMEYKSIPALPSRTTYLCEFVCVCVCWQTLFCMLCVAAAAASAAGASATCARELSAHASHCQSAGKCSLRCGACARDLT